MANKREISVAINLTTKMENIQQNLTKLRNDLSRLSLPQSVVNEFSSLFSNMEKEIDKLVSKTANGQLKLIDSKDAIKSIEKIDSLYSLLIQKYESKGIGTAALKEDQQAINALTSAIKEYGNQTRDIEKDQAKLSREVERQTKKQQELLEIQKEQKVVSEAELSAQRAAEKQAAKEARAAEKELLEARRLLDEKIALSAGKYTKEDITRKNSNLRKTDAYKNYKRASENAAIANKNKKDIDAIGATMVTLAQQKEALQQVENAILKAKNNLKQFNETQKATAESEAFTKIKEELLSLDGIDFSKYGIDISAIDNVEDLQKALERLVVQVQNNSKALDKNFASSLKTTGKELDGVQGEVKETASALEELEERSDAADAMTNRIKQFLGVSGAAQVMRAALRDAMQTITELDAVMTEMAVVTDLTVGDYWDQLPEYSKQASELGVSINSAYEAATLYYQQGLKGNEVTKISAETLKMAKIAGLDAADATDKMTAALRGFNMEINEASAQRVSDVYSQLAAITAADTKEIANAMTKTASIAHSAGMEFETTAAFLAQIVETTRESAETAGTAMKTVIARFQELKKSPDEIGEVDGEIVDANAIEAALRTVGVSLRDTNGQFRELDDVFLELSSKWDGLDKNTQRYIATIAAGSRQQSRFIAMMSDYGRTQELVNAANNSAGASNRQFEKTLDSLSSKIEKLKNAWHEFTMGILESDLIKKGVDILTKFLEIINKATRSFDGMAGSLTKILSVVTIFKLGSKIFDKFKQPIADLFLYIVNMAESNGYNSAKKFHEGQKRYIQEMYADQSGVKEGSGEIQKAEKSGIFGISAFKRAQEAHGQIEYYRELSNDKQGRDKIKKELEDLERDYSFREDGSVYSKKQPGKGTKSNIGKNTDKAKELKESRENLIRQLGEYEKAEDEVAKNSKKQWDSIAQGMGAVSDAISGVGLGLSLVGGILSNMGFEDAGEKLSKIGSVITMVGSGLSALVPIISLVGSITWASLAPILPIILAITAAVVVLGVVLKNLYENSPQGKLKAAEKSAKVLSAAAEEAANNFEELSNSIDSLGDKYKALDELTRGTKEWKDAVMDINSEVLNLVDKYPQLAEFLEGGEGVLRLNLDDAGLQEIIIEAETASISTKAASSFANAEVEQARAYKELADLETDLKNEVYEVTYENTKDALKGTGEGWLFRTIFAFGQGLLRKGEAKETLGTLEEEDKEPLAKALAQGKIYEKNGELIVNAGLDDNTEELNRLVKDYSHVIKEFGGELQDIGQKIIDAELKVSANLKQAAETAKMAIKQPEGLEPAEAAQFNNYIDSLLDEGDYLRMVEENKKKLSSTTLSENDKEEIVSRVWGADATLDGTTVKDLTGQILAEDVNEDRLKILKANYLATQSFKASGESIPEMIEQIKGFLPNVSGETIERLFSDKEGSALTQGDIAEIEKYILPDASKLYKLFETWGLEMQNVFGDYSDLWDYVYLATDVGNRSFDSSSRILEKAKYGTGQQFQRVTAEQATSLAQIAAEASLTAWGQGNFLTAFNALVESADFKNLTEEQQGRLINGISGMSQDITNRGDWESLLKTFAENGIKIEGLDDFINTTIDAVSSTYTNAYLQNMGVGENLIKFYQNAANDGDKGALEKFHQTFKNWKRDYDLANSESAKAEHELITQAANELAEQYNEQIEQQEKLLEEQESIYDAVNEASSKIVDKLQKQIEESRQIRENTEKEQGLGDKYAQLAYLSQDTSGANSLEIMQLEKEIADAEQDYMDSLVDQAISELEDANARAEEQRNEQIELARAQLDEQKDASDFYNQAKTYVDSAKSALAEGIPIETTALGKLYQKTIFASDYERSSFWNALYQNVSAAINEAPSPQTKIYTTGGGPKGDVVHTIKYATGGLADFTGPAWLDGTPSKPEYVLNAAQTERFFSLIDVLEGYDTKEKTSKQKNEISIDVDINVENISSDYDVEQMASKIRSMLRDDAMYRNVNNINLTR